MAENSLEMKKIGIITYHSAHNFGAMLQAHALQESLIDMGYDAFFINCHPESRELNNRRKIRVRNLKSFLTWMAFLFFRRKLNRRYRLFERFRREYLNQTERYLDATELRDSPPEIDAYVCGSDQIWNLDDGGLSLFYLKFEDRPIPAISYAASFGKEEIPKEYHQDLKIWLSKFSAISVREQSAQNQLTQILNRDVSLDVDPVMLKSASYWREIAVRPKYNKPYICFYSLEVTETASKVVTSLSKKLGLPVVIVGKPGKFMIKCKSIVAIDSGPREFLGWLTNASLVITNSFHSTTFSALLGVPFVTIAHTTKNTRIECLLDLVDQRQRMVSSPEDIEHIKDECLHSIDHASIVERIRNNVADSRAFLEGSLSKCLS